MGLSLGSALGLKISKLLQALAGLILVGFVWVAVMKTQSSLNDQALTQSVSIDHFAEAFGHCGINISSTLKSKLGVGRGVEDPRIKEFFRQIDCRNNHYLLLEKKDRVECGGGENPIECRTRWMSVFAERGIWTYASRKMFFDRVMELWESNRKEEALVSYVLKDQELELGRQALSRQMGIERGPKNVLLIELQEDLENMKLTEKLFQTITPILDDVQDKTAPFVIKYKDAAQEARQKIAQIPDFEKQLKKLQEE